MQKGKWSPVSVMHLKKMIFRGGLFLLGIVLYLMRKADAPLSFGLPYPAVFLALIWICFMAEMVLRFFPSGKESPGCQKHFEKNYVPGEALRPEEVKRGNRGALIVFGSWVILNLIIAMLFRSGIIDLGILLLISLFYSVSDMICILFFCPFQLFMMRNRCCVSCRIYNWDFAMMFTPFLFAGNVYGWTLFAMGLLLLAHWEMLHFLHPERFYKRSNLQTACANCTELLCRHKKLIPPMRKDSGFDLGR